MYQELDDPTPLTPTAWHRAEVQRRAAHKRQLGLPIGLAAAIAATVLAAVSVLSPSASLASGAKKSHADAASAPAHSGTDPCRPDALSHGVLHDGWQWGDHLLRHRFDRSRPLPGRDDGPERRRRGLGWGREPRRAGRSDTGHL